MFLRAGYILEDVQGGKKEMVITSILTYLVLFWRAFLGVERWIIWVLFLLVQAKGPQVVAQTVVMGPGWSVEGTVMVTERPLGCCLAPGSLSGCGQTGGRLELTLYSFPVHVQMMNVANFSHLQCPKGTGLLVLARDFTARLQCGLCLPLLLSPSGSWWSRLSPEGTLNHRSEAHARHQRRWPWKTVHVQIQWRVSSATAHRGEI